MKNIMIQFGNILGDAIYQIFNSSIEQIGSCFFTKNIFFYDFLLKNIDLHKVFLSKINDKVNFIIFNKFFMLGKNLTRFQIENFLRIKFNLFKIKFLHNLSINKILFFYKGSDSRFLDILVLENFNNNKDDSKIAFKLMNIGSFIYKNKTYQRIIGKFIFNNSLINRENDDHKIIGKNMNLFKSCSAVGKGLILWENNGVIILKEIKAFIDHLLINEGYLNVITPHIAKLDLYKQSGHFPYYKSSQFSPIINQDKDIESDNDNENYLLKPMNCPLHINIFSSNKVRYKDLPIRFCEFGTVYRWEKSGELNGLTRARGFTQDDAHIFCTQNQIKNEIESCLKIIQEIFLTLGIFKYTLRLSLKDYNSNKYIGNNNLWNKSEDILKEVIKQFKSINFIEKRGEAAFYGPKIDFIINDALGREWQLGTIQLDYNLPKRFNLSYIGIDNKKYRPIIIHRAPLGSLERFIGILIEYFRGDFPLWLAPVQVVILCLDIKISYIIENYLFLLSSNNIRCFVDNNYKDTLSSRIKKYELKKVPFVLIIGRKEFENNQIFVRSRIHKMIRGSMFFNKFLDLIKKIIYNKILPNNKV